MIHPSPKMSWPLVHAAGTLIQTGQKVTRSFGFEEERHNCEAIVDVVLSMSVCPEVNIDSQAAPICQWDPLDRAP